METSILVEAAKQVPALIVMAWLAKTFLSAMRSERDLQVKLEEARAESMKEMGEACHDFQKDLSERNTAMMTKVERAVDNNTQVLIKVADRLEHN